MICQCCELDDTINSELCIKEREFAAGMVAVVCTECCNKVWFMLYKQPEWFAWIVSTDEDHIDEVAVKSETKKHRKVSVDGRSSRTYHIKQRTNACAEVMLAFERALKLVQKGGTSDPSHN